MLRLRRRSLGRFVGAAALVAVSACAVSGPDDDPVLSEPAQSTTSEPDPAALATGDDADRIDADQPHVQERIQRGGDHTVVFVGDSVLVSVSDDLASRVDGNLVFDAANCRQLANPVTGGCGGNPDSVDSGLDAIDEALDDLALGEGPDVAVLVLANNASVTDDELDEAMERLSGVRRVWWVNARIDGFGRQDLNNAALEDLVERNPRAQIIDWFSESDDPDLFRDHVHPNAEGQRRLAILIAEHLECDCAP